MPFPKERSPQFNADSTVTIVKIAEIISGTKKEICALMRHKNTGTFPLTTDQDEWPENFMLLLEALLLISVLFVLYIKNGHLFGNWLNQGS